MHSVYFARHGETVWNVEDKICGMTDSPLTEKGRAQAAALGQQVKASGARCSVLRQREFVSNAWIKDFGLQSVHTS